MSILAAPHIGLDREESAYSETTSFRFLQTGD